jgi:hypothetical protein
VFAVAVSALVTYAVLAAARPSPEIVLRQFDLPPAKATALYQILKPKSVKVIVGRDGGRVSIKGTAGECDAVAGLARIITRCCSGPSCEARQCVERARKSWTTHRTYRLPGNSKAKALFQALAPEDVPVLVSRSGKKVTVDASPQDQETIARVVDILRGRRL